MSGDTPRANEYLPSGTTDELWPYNDGVSPSNARASKASARSIRGRVT